MVGYRIVELKNGKVYSLFHGTNGSRIIPYDVWHKANIKIVKDGSKGTQYTSGWHFLKSEEDAINFLNRMFKIKTNRFIVKCYVRGNIRPKEHSVKGKCWLADEIKIYLLDVMDAIYGSNM
jgi:hypothetical protein